MMIIPGMPVMLPVASGGGIGPAITITIGSFAGDVVRGFIKSGGYLAGDIGESGGSLSAQPLPGFICDAIVDFSGDITMYTDGDATTALATLSGLMIAGVLCTVKTAPSYYGPDAITTTVFNRSSTLAPSTRVIQLV